MWFEHWPVTYHEGFFQISMAIVKLFQIKWVTGCLFFISWNQQCSGHELKTWLEPHTLKSCSGNWTKLMQLEILVAKQLCRGWCGVPRDKWRWRCAPPCWAPLEDHGWAEARRAIAQFCTSETAAETLCPILGSGRLDDVGTNPMEAIGQSEGCGAQEPQGAAGVLPAVEQEVGVVKRSC